MNTKIADTRNENANDAPSMCVWKMVMMDNFRGKGTSFIPSRLSLSAIRCVECDGFSSECYAYAAMMPPHVIECESTIRMFRDF